MKIRKNNLSPLPVLWRVDEDGAGCWYLGDTDETFLSEDLYVDGWWELPKKPEGRDK